MWARAASYIRRDESPVNRRFIANTQHHRENQLTLQPTDFWNLDWYGDWGQVIKHHESTIRREILRNRGESGYRAFQAHATSHVRSINSRNAASVPQVLWPRVKAFLRVQHSPEQISAYLPISHESIYRYIYRDRSCKLRSYLRSQKKKRRCYGANRSLSSAPIANRRGIELHPASVERRARIGHWEVDTIIGKGHKGAIVTLVERKSGFTLFKLVANKTARVVSAAMIALLMPSSTWWQSSPVTTVVSLRCMRRLMLFWDTSPTLQGRITVWFVSMSQRAGNLIR